MKTFSEDRTTGERFSVSTWSLHRTLGRPPIFGPGEARPANWNLGTSLLDLPASIREAGFGMLEICHFHLEKKDDAYLDQMREKMELSEVDLYSFLIDGGDLSDPEHGLRDREWMESWFPLAKRLGARCVRVGAGKAPPTKENLTRSMEHLKHLADAAENDGLRLMTENWQELLSTPESVIRVLDGLEGRVGLCLDFGNWPRERRYRDLEAIAARAESCHAKADFGTDGQLDEEDFSRCLEIMRSSGFKGPYTHIFSSISLDEWDGLERQRAIVSLYV